MKENLPDSPECVVLIIDDHAMVRHGLKLMFASLSKQMTFKVFEAESAEQASRIILSREIDIIILDYKMPGAFGAEVVYKILRSRPAANILVLSNYNELPYVISMIEAGAKGYVLKNIEPAELLIAVRTILSGRLYYSNDVAVKLIDSEDNKQLRRENINNILTKREIEVLYLIAMEHTNEEIAEKLFIGKRTIDTHRQNLLHKLRVKNTVGLIKAAYKFGLLD